MNRQDAEEYTKSLSQIFRGSWEQIAWAEGQGIPQALGLTTQQWVKERLGGYVQQSIEERRKAVKILTDEGKSTRQVGEIIGVDGSTVVRDLAANAAKTPSKEPQTAANAADKQESVAKNKSGDATKVAAQSKQSENERIEQAKAKVRTEAQERINQITAEFQKRIHSLETAIVDLNNKKRKEQDLSEKIEPNFRPQNIKISEALVFLIQHDNLAKMLSDLEVLKDNVTSETDAESLRKVIHGLISLSERAKSWAKRITPTNNRWKYEVQDE
jgi:hypothetical protein